VLALVQPGGRAELVSARLRAKKQSYKVENLKEVGLARRADSSFDRIETLRRNATARSLFGACGLKGNRVKGGKPTVEGEASEGKRSGGHRLPSLFTQWFEYGCPGGATLRSRGSTLFVDDDEGAGQRLAVQRNGTVANASG